MVAGGPSGTSRQQLQSSQHPAVQSLEHTLQVPTAHRASHFLWDRGHAPLVFACLGFSLMGLSCSHVIRQVSCRTCCHRVHRLMLCPIFVQ